jgi:gamma-glutamyltranspeptidase/glutathione hydrolase
VPLWVNEGLSDFERGQWQPLDLMAVRDAAIADPRRMGYEPSRLLDPSTIALLAEAVDPDRAAPQERLTATADAVQARLLGRPRGTPRPAPAEVRPDTAHFVVVDADGFVVSCIQSLFSAFGSGIVVPGTGILLHNRGAGFSLEEGHPNELRPGQRPMHTLAPAMALAGDRVTAAFGCMGGHAQAQLHLQMIQGLAGDGLDPATVADRPRWFARPDPVTGAPEVLVEARLEAAGLGSRGHDVVRVGPYDEVVGHAQIVLVDEARGALLGAADPRSDGIALAY